MASRSVLARVMAASIALAFVAVVLLALAPTAFADTDGTHNYTITAGTATIDEYIGPGGIVLIPSTLGGSAVTAIGQNAFANCGNVTDVAIPYSVTSIGYGAFEGCSSLTSVALPGSVTSIDGSAFRGCSSLTAVTIPNSVTSIDAAAFYGCSSLTSVTIPSGITNIAALAFYGCSSLTAVTIPNSVTSIDSYAFNGCSSLATMTIPASVTYIGESAFHWCTALTSVTIPSGVTSIGDSVFYGCSSLTSVTIPGSVTVIDRLAFSGCSSLTGVTIPNGVTSIGNAAFEGCTSLTSVTLPSSLARLDDSAFSGCSSLASVTIPSGVTSIDAYAFEGCTSLTSVTIPSGVTSIGYSAFQGSGLTSVTIPSSVSSIDSYAFSACGDMASAVFLGNAPTVGANVFYGTSIRFAVYYVAGSTGFPTPPGPWWPGLNYAYRTSYCDSEGRPIRYTLTYGAGANGTISGTSPQTVDHGASGTPVTAVPNARYHFTSWSDGLAAATRIDSDVAADKSVSALFERDQRAVDAVEGGTRYDTAVQAVKRAFPTTATTVVVAWGRNFPDALGASALCGAYDAPLLLTETGYLPDVVRDEIKALGVSHAVIIGSESVVSNAVENDLVTLLAGEKKVDRIHGAGRYDTAKMVATEMGRIAGARDDVFLAVGDNFPDALAASPAAFDKKWPMILTARTGLSAQAADALTTLTPSRVHILGSNGAVPDNVENELKERFPGVAVDRWQGGTRYQTAIDIANRSELPWLGTAVATGQDFPDALAGGVMQGKLRGVVLLTPTANLNADTANAITAHAAEIRTVRYLGSTSAVADAVRSKVSQILE